MMMKSRQLNFYLNMHDQFILDAKIQNVENTVFCKYLSPNKSPVFLKTTKIDDMGNEYLKILILREQDIDKLIFREIKDTDSFSINTIKSPVLEYSRCFVSDDLIRRGRLYFIKTYYNEQESLIEKEPCFVAWASRVIKEARGGLILEKPRNYFGPGGAFG